MTRDADIRFMNHAMALAVRGRGLVEPNPMVGAVIVRDGQVVGEGWHERYGGPHAEIHALRQAGDRARGADLYVTLEPCCHHGKTPPCTEAVIAAGIRRVIAAMADPFVQVSGRGFELLREAGILTESGICETEARQLNAPYLTRLTRNRPWIIAKWAMSLDGKIATKTGESRWISSEESRRRVHELRGRMDAIVVGRGTLVADDPRLTARPPGPRTPARIVLTRGGPLPDQCRLLDTIREAPVILAVLGTATYDAWRGAGAEIVHAQTLEEFLHRLAERGMTNVLVEGGSQVLGAFHDAGLIDEAHVFVAPRVIGGRAPTPVTGEGLQKLSESSLFDDTQSGMSGPDLWIRSCRKV